MFGEEQYNLLRATNVDKTVSALNTRVVRDPNIRYTQSSQIPLYSDAMENFHFYDFMEDMIIKAPVNNVLIVEASKLLPTKKGDVLAAQIPEGTLLVLKGTMNGETGIGGEFIPMIGTLVHMRIMFRVVNEILTSVSNGNFTGLPDMRNNLSEDDRNRINNLLKRPIYANPIIQDIMKLYNYKPPIQIQQAPQAQTTTELFTPNAISRIRDKIAAGKPGPVRVETGFPVNATGAYNFIDMLVRSPTDEVERQMRFALPRNVSPQQREAWKRELGRLFGAREIPSGEQAEGARSMVTSQPIRSTIGLVQRPILMATEEHASILPNPEDFQAYLRQINENVHSYGVDNTQILHGEAPLEGEEEFEEESMDDNLEDY